MGKITIIGAGNGGCTYAAYLGSGEMYDTY